MGSIGSRNRSFNSDITADTRITIINNPANAARQVSKNTSAPSIRHLFSATFLSALVEAFANRVVLARFGQATVYWYGVWMGVAFASAHLSSSAWLFAMVKPHEALLYRSFFSGGILGAVVGGRLFSLVMEDGVLLAWKNPSIVFRRGFWIQGGFAGLCIAIAMQCRWNGLPVLPVLDAVALAQVL